nr:MAG TPA: hypothetical protein [Caudoviricetes sp.]
MSSKIARRGGCLGRHTRKILLKGEENGTFQESV